MPTYYVDPAGNDGNPGTELLPWRTVAHAATAVAAGDTVIYEDGTYDIGAQVTAWTSGTVGNVITHQARNSRLAIWEQTAYTSGAIELTSESYVTFDGIQMQQGVITNIGWFVDLNGCDHITLEDCEITQTCPHCIYIRDGCSDITVNNSELHCETTTVGVGRDGILIYGPGANTNIVITNNTIYHTPHAGINTASNCHANDTYTIYGNTIYDNMSHCIGLDGAGSAVIYDNVLHGAGNYGGVVDDKNGLAVFETGPPNVHFYRNDIYDCNGGGVLIFSTCGTVTIYNNTLENNNSTGNDYGSLGILFRAGSQGDIEIINNIIYHTQAGRRCLFAENGTETAISDFDYNLWYDSTAEETMRRAGVTYDTFALYAAAGYEPNSVFDDDPLFVNQAAHDFSLQAGSPAIDAGKNVGLPYQGGAPDIGAHERSAGGGIVMLVVVVTVVTVVQA